MENILQIDILTDKGVFKTLKTSDKELILGREKNCHIYLNDINISRAHLKITWTAEEVSIIDLGSSNGTYINKHKLTVGYINKTFPSDEIVLGNSIYKLKLTLLSTEIDKVLSPPHEAADIPKPIVPKEVVIEHNKIDEEIKFLKIPEKIAGQAELEMDFKNVGLNLPKYNTPVDHANEIIREAEYLKNSTIKGAEVKKEKIIHQARVEAARIINEKYDEYQTKAQNLIIQTKAEITKLKYESEILNKEKEQQTLEEIKQDWKTHQEQVSVDIQSRKNQLEKENALNAELFMEKIRVEIMTEKNKILSDAEHDVLKKKRELEDFIFQERKKHSELLADLSQTQSEALFREKKKHDDLAEQERRDHDAKILKELNEHTSVITNLKTELENYKKEHLELHNLLKTKNVEKHALLDDIVRFSKEHSESETKFNHIKNELEKYTDEYNKVKSELNNFSTTKSELEKNIAQLTKNYEEMQSSFKSITEKNKDLKDEYSKLVTTFENLKKDKKKEIESEITALRKAEMSKFDDFKTQQAQSYEKIKQSHIESIKKISIDLSQEIATKIEHLTKSNPTFNFEKTLEVINFVLQVKSAQFGGGSAQHNEQLDVWKKRQKAEKRTIYYQTFAGYLVISVIGYFLYNRLSVDPIQKQLRELAAQRQEQALQNVYVPEQESEIKDNYVDATIYTRNFTAKYLSNEIQQDFIKMASKKFLSRWKVPEETMIKVISASRAFVQEVDEKSKKLTKDRYRADIEKLKVEEQNMIKEHEDLFGSNVRYLDYKKIEKEYFSKIVK